MTPDTTRPSARPTPEWFANGVVYQIWLRSFTPEGTLAAAAKRLGSIAELGANLVYLSPVMLADPDPRREFWSVRQCASVAQNPRNPYRTSNFNRIDPEYGTEADLRAFLAEAHRAGLKVLMDLVYHHTGPTCDLLSRPGFYQLGEDGKPLCNSWHFLRLNLANAELRRYFMDDMRHWLSCGADGFRFDVSGAVPLDFWEEARRTLGKEKADLIMVAENEGLAEEQALAFDASYSFGWYDRLRQVVVEGADAAVLREHHDRLEAAYPRGSRFLRYSDNHDLHRADVVFGEAASRALTVLHFSMDGIPFLYNGQEIGDTTPQDLFSHWPVRWETSGTPTAKAKREFVRKCCAVRRGPDSPATADFAWIENDRADSVLCFRRREGKRAWFTAINLRNRPVQIRLASRAEDPHGFRDLLDEGKEIALGAEGRLDLPSFGAVWGIQKARG
ncbi:MAG: hypothetical protein J0L75_05685 [Spirochaetes bacterium]|nr:hypothetical protein [Spirochaetota bacterium]